MFGILARTNEYIIIYNINNYYNKTIMDKMEIITKNIFYLYVN